MNVGGKRISVGGIAGSSIGTISRCRANVTLNAAGKDSAYAGGIVGFSSGNIEYCSSMGSITLESTQSGSAGKIVGFLEDGREIKECHSTVEVTSSGIR